MDVGRSCTIGLGFRGGLGVTEIEERAMPSSAQDHGDLSPTSPEDGFVERSSEPTLPGRIESDPLEGGRGLVFGTLISALLLSGIAALAMLVWAG
jgi:hypothetical protein